MVVFDRWRCWRGSMGVHLCPGERRERFKRHSDSTAWTRTSRGFAAPPPRAGWHAASSYLTWGCRYTQSSAVQAQCTVHKLHYRKMCLFVLPLVQYSFDERQPQCKGSAGQHGSDDTADMDDSFSKQVNPHSDKDMMAFEVQHWGDIVIQKLQPFPADRRIMYARI